MAKTTVAEQLQLVRQFTTSGDARRLRELARLSQSEVGRSVGVDASTVARWERGERLPRGEAAIRYARLLDRLQRAAERAVAS